MRAIFDLFDKDGDGAIGTEDLSALHAKLGEPITEAEAKEAVDIIASGGTLVTFEDFVAYWDGSHPSLRKAMATAETPEAVVAERERKRQWYSARFKFMKAKIPNPAIARVATEAVGPCPSLEYRQFFYYQDGAQRVPISPWHDIPLINGDGTYNFIVEIPKWSRRKFEVATGEAYNPIKQDVKNGVLREYAYGDMLFNYGCLPQTWEDPKHITPDTGCGGDNDPIDFIDIGSKMWATGSIVRVKILGVLGLIDAGETDWKVVGISAEDAMAPLLNDIDDVEVHVPGAIEALHRWLKFYKAPVINEFAFGGAARDAAYATRIVEETHLLWQQLVDERAAGGVSIKSAGLARSTSNARLAKVMGMETSASTMARVSSRGDAMHMLAALGAGAAAGTTSLLH